MQRFKFNWKIFSKNFFKLMMGYAFIISILYFLPATQAQMVNRGMPHIVHYSSEDYHSIDQNWTTVQDNQGVMYFGNTNGLILFDGNEWKIISPSRYMSIIRSMSKNHKGTIYAGSINNFGYLQSAPDGEISLHSLTGQLPLNRRSFNYISDIACLDDMVFFRTPNSLFIYKNDLLTNIIDAKGSFSCISVVNKNVYIHDLNTGVGIWKNGRIQLLNQGDYFKNMNIIFILPYKQNALLIGTHQHGIFCWNNGKVENWGNSLVCGSGKAEPLCGKNINGNTFAIGTSSSDIRFFDVSGECTGEVKLVKSTITSLFTDKENNLWVTTTKGIYHIEVNSAFTYYFEPMGLNEIILDAAFYNDCLYVAGTEGVFYKPFVSIDLQESNKPFKGLALADGQSWQLKVNNNCLYISHNPGIIVIEKQQTRYYLQDKGNIYSIVFPNDNPDYLIASVDNGLLRVNRRDFSSKKIWESEETPRYLEITPHNEVWMISETLKGAFRLNFTSDYDTVKTSEFFNKEKGLPEQPSLSIILADSEINILTESGFYQFNQASDRFVLNKILNQNLSPQAFLANTDSGGNIWLGGMNHLSQKQKIGSGVYLTIDTVFRRVLNHHLYFGTLMPDGTSIITCNQGVIQYDPAVKYKPAGFKALIIKVQLLNTDTTAFDSGLNALHSRSIDLISTTPEAFEIPYENNSIRFHCASVYFVEPQRTLFSYKLSGYESKNQEWSEWSPDHKKEYTNLNEGSYSFFVKSKNIYGEESTVATYNFTILAPWYRTLWAYIGYFFALLFLLLTAIYLNTRRLRLHNLKLENIIKDRTSEIQSQKEEIEKQQTIILSDRDRLKQLSLQLQELNDFKSRFFANISHELRTPLTLIISPLEKLIEKSSGNKEMNTYLVMDRNAKRLLSLVNQLLDLSKLDKGAISLNLDFAEVNSFIENIIHSFQYLADTKSITLNFRDDCPKTWMPFDKDILEKILDNLLSNAIKFSFEGGRVTVVLSIREEKNCLQIAVNDNGPGIAEEELSKIFNRFYQVENPAKTKNDGVGIGLAFVKELLIIHQGTISVKSQPGSGTEFTVLLPLSKSAYSSDEILTPPENSEESTQLVAGDDIPEIQESFTANDIVKENILIVEDNPDMLEFIANNLPEQYSVTKANNGREGLLLAIETMPDLIITDVMMPGMDGIEMTRNIRNDRHTSHIPVIMLTARASIESRIEGLEARADDYLSKPFSIRELTVRIRNLILIRKGLRKKFLEEILINPSEVTTNPLDEEFLGKAVDLVRKNMTNSDFGIDLLCTELAMSRSSLHRKLKALTNQSASEFINTIRIKESAQLLKQKQHSISEIAYEVGFNSVPYFNVLFKKHFGVVPGDFR